MPITVTVMGGAAITPPPPPPPPPPTGAIIYGASDGSGGMAATISQLGTHMLREYDQDKVYPASWAASAGHAASNAGQKVCHSCKPSIVNLAAGLQSEFDKCLTLHDGRPDTADEWEIMHHEPYGKAGFSGAQWSDASIAYYENVIGPVNKTRTHPIKYALCIQGWFSETQISTYFTPGAMAACDSVGYDCYNLTQITRGAARAKAAGKPFSIAECGFLTGVTHTDDQINGWMLGDLSTELDPVVDQTAFALWFNAGTNSIVGPGYTKSIATWKKRSNP